MNFTKMKKQTIRNLIKTISASVQFLSFLLRNFYLLEIKRFDRFPARKGFGGTLTMLANAPSLKQSLPVIMANREKSDSDFVVMNYFADCKEFTELRPKYYCFADPMFYRPTHRLEDVKRIFDILQNNVDWDMTIFVLSFRLKQFLRFSNISNEHIRIVPVFSDEYNGLERFRNWAYRHNLAAPSFSTVAILAIYSGINMGYGKINLYGADMTFFDNLCVNEQNELCSIYRHFNEDKAELKPIVRNDNDTVFKISDYVLSIGKMFKSHDLVSEYAKYADVEIINCTDCSLIDCYKRVNMQ